MNRMVRDKRLMSGMVRDRRLKGSEWLGIGG